MKATSLLCLFVAAASLGLISTTPSEADAAWRRFNAANCTDENVFANGSMQKIGFGGAAGLYNNDTVTHWLACPVDEDNTMWIDAATYVGVHVNRSTQAANGVSASACVLYDQAIGGACGASASTASSGAQVLQPSRSVWNAAGFGETYAGDFAYIDVGLSWVNGGNTTNGIRGYTFSN